MRDKFRDGYEGEGKLEPYEWAIGHESEDPQSQTLNVERTALTTGVGYVRQQGSPSPTIFKLSGWIVHKEQLEKMQAYYGVCAGKGPGPARTVFWTDIEKGEHEVLITEFSPQRELGRSGGTGLGYVWRYTLTMEVIS